MSNYFIGGLPRSGSTLLANILHQNPKLKVTVDRGMGTNELLEKTFNLESPKIVLLYRPVLEILASFIQLADQYPVENFIDKSMQKESFIPLSYRPLNDARCDWLMRPNGEIDKINTAFLNSIIYKDWFYLLDYHDLTNNTEVVLESLYKFFQIDSYKHNLQNIPQHDNSKDGELYGIPTLHTIRPQISKSKTNPEKVLSDYVIQKYSNTFDWFTKGWLQSQS